MQPMKKPAGEDFSAFPIDRDPETFMRELLRELAGTLEEIVGLEDASGFISTVGCRISDVMNAEYRHHAGVARLSIEQIAHALVDLKRRIGGDYSIQSISNDEIVLIGSKCPFGKHVEGRNSLCMMTSNVFGKLAAENTGYAEVAIPKSFAAGDDCCHVIVSFKPDRFAIDENTREYYAAE